MEQRFLHPSLEVAIIISITVKLTIIERDCFFNLLSTLEHKNQETVNIVPIQNGPFFLYIHDITPALIFANRAW